ncbi:MAG: DUF58 domain-containing protein [Candidatus Delongbacteria bacterium]|nr:DUF58 domain-containing protein [Candidatus Delongbacteria bacterium]MBN2836629.1 DUF58 domain-containing protein [Candidatus Delongbacteria bacterium]
MNEKDILKKVRALEIKTRGMVNEHFSGEYHSRFKGRGMNFSEVREYSYGDDIRNIDWNVTARMKSPYIKVFEEERELVLMLLVDVSGSGVFGSSENLKKEIATELAAVLAFSAIKNNDKVGLILFSDKIEKFLPPKKGKAHVFRIIRELIYFKAENTGTNIEQALEFLGRVQKKRCSAFVISDFMSENYEKGLQIVSSRHDLVGIDLSDNAEKNLDKLGFIELYDNESGKRGIFDLSSKRNRSIFKANLEKLNSEKTKLFNRNKVDRVAIDINEAYIKPLMVFFKSRSKR